MAPRGTEPAARAAQHRYDPTLPVRLFISGVCGPLTVEALAPHMTLLVNLGDLALGSAGVEAAFREFLAFVDALCTRCRSAEAAAGLAERHAEALRGQLRGEREGRDAEGFRSALGSLECGRALEAERQARSGLEARLGSLGRELEYALGMQRRQAAELQALTRICAEAELGMEARLRDEVARQQEIMEAGQERLRRHFEQQVLEAGRLEQSLREEMVRERSRTAAAQEDTLRLKKAMEPWRQLQGARLPCVMQLAHFLQSEGLELAHALLPVRARVPVLALEWPPHTELDMSLAWRSLSERGCMGLLVRLCAGELAPEDLELTAACVEGRWIGALHGELEAPRLGALLALQGLRPDLAVAASCRVVPLRQPLLPKGVAQLDPQRRCGPPVGPGARGGQGAQVARTPALDADPEAGLKAMLRGCPLEEELLSALAYVHAAYPDALRRRPP